MRDGLAMCAWGRVIHLCRAGPSLTWLEVAPDPADQRQSNGPGAVLAGEGGGAVQRAWNDDATVPLRAVHGVAGDLLGGHPYGARGPLLDPPDAGDLGELGLDRPRAD